MYPEVRVGGVMDALEAFREDQALTLWFQGAKADANNKSIYDWSVNKSTCPSFGTQLDNDFYCHS